MEAGEWKLENGSWRMEAGEWKLERCAPTPHATTAFLHPLSYIVVVYFQINFTHFTAVLNYLVFYYYNIYLIL